MGNQKQQQVKEVFFNGDKLLAVLDNDTGKIYVGVNVICNSLGIQRKMQVSKLKTHEVLSEGLRLYGIPSNGGIQQTKMIDIQYLPMWLITIRPSMVKPEQKEKLIAYQLKAKDVLANAFLADMKQAHLSKFIIPQTYPAALRLAADLQEKIEILEPKAEKYDDFIDSRGCFNLNQVAKTLHTGRTRLFKKLREIGILNKDNSPKQEYIEQGLFTTKVYTIKCKGFKKTVIQPLTNPRGLDFVSEVMRCHQ